MAIAAQDALGKGLMEQYQRLSSMDQMEQMKELEMQKEALELEAKESQLLKESSLGPQ